MKLRQRRLKRFRRFCEVLPTEVLTDLEQAYKQFCDDPTYPALKFKKLRGYDDLWEVYVNDQYRAVGILVEDTIYWDWIGTKNSFFNEF